MEMHDSFYIFFVFSFFVKTDQNVAVTWCWHWILLIIVAKRGD